MCVDQLNCSIFTLLGYCSALVTKCLSTSAREFRYLSVEDSLGHLPSNTTSYFGWKLLPRYPPDGFGKKYAEFANASWRLNGSDPALLFPLPMIYTTRPS
uniref:Secreted protein n=1 Tax=Heterorhabditis bacteriophora TaxID=37862 RepID=A0A1I7WXP9_HETBA